MHSTKRNYKASKLRMFLFFLLLALIFWVLSKFSNRTTAQLVAKIQYTDIPSNVSIDETADNEIRFDLNATGFQMLSNKINPPLVQISIENYYQDGQEDIHLSNSELIKLISSEIDKNSQVQHVVQNQLIIPLNRLVTKRVPVRIQTELTFKKGFFEILSQEKLQDSVTISGPDVLVSSITYLESTTFRRNNISEDIKTTIAIVNPAPQELKIEPKKLEIIIEVEEFAQKSLTIPIELVNKPEGVKIQLIPESISLTFDVPMSKFNTITVQDFKLVCDFNTKTADQNHLVPKLIDQPEGIQHIEFETRNVEYLIFK